MPEVVLFAEDFAHETFIAALLRRLAVEHGIEIHLIPRSTTGGAGNVGTELRHLLQAVSAGREGFPDAIIAARDANCKGYMERRKGLEKVVPDELRDRMIYAIPDPHIERWLLLDSSAFKRVLGKGCSAPDLKCERHRYKRLLRQAVQEAGITPLLGGLEHTEELVGELDLRRIEKTDAAFGKFVGDLRSQIKLWSA